MMQWLEQNRLILNSEKTKVINFKITNSRNNSSSKFVVGEDEVEPCSTVKFLGVHIDSRLKFIPHIDAVCKKLSSGIFVLRCLAKFTDTDVLMAAYYGLIYPFLTYAVEIWGHECVRTSFVFKMQKRAIRAIFRKPCQFSCKSLFSDHNILTFPSIYILNTVLYVHKNLSRFTQNRSYHQYSLRRNNNILVQSHRTTFFQKHLDYNGVQLFNSLPEELKLEENPRRFGNGVRRLLLSGCFYSVRDFLSPPG